jgi:uncharacterized phage-associated protein
MTQAMQFSRGKFKELVVYLCAASERARDEGFGMVKLNKLLYRADFEAYRLLGHPITGETYEKQEYGPVARDLPIVLDELGAAGRLGWQFIATGPHTRNVPTVTEDPDAVADMSAFPSDEREVIENTLRELAVYGGKGASEWSHEESAGWKAAPEYGHAIDYSSTFISTEPVSPEDLDRARRFVHERGWVRNPA